MDKITINGKDIELNMNSKAKLSDDDLETVSGGFQSIQSTLFYSWVCKTCYTEGANFTNRDSAYMESMKSHKAATGHAEFIGLCAHYREGVGFGVGGYWEETV